MDEIPKNLKDIKAINKTVDELINKMDLDTLLVLNSCLSMALIRKVKKNEQNTG